MLVLAPASYALWSSRRLVRRLDDPLFPELLLAHMQRVGATAGGAIGAGIVLAHDYLGWTIVSMLLGVVVAGFPARKKIYRESWSLASYLSHTARFWFALFGFFLLVCFAPALMALAGDWALEIGILYGALAVLSLVFSARLVPRVLRARVLDRTHLEGLFAEVLSKADCDKPRICEAGAPGGSFVNALALPSWTSPGVVLTSDLLDSLDDDETQAIFAHEVAHLEQHRGRPLIAGYVSSLVLVAITVFLWSGPIAPSLRGWEWLWAFVVLVALAMKMQQHRAHETESDVRAVELTGKPEAMISALTKIHTLLRLSRRWSEKYEQCSTHPSLSRRIQAIRKATGEHRVEPFTPVVVIAPDGKRRGLILDAEKLHLVTGFSEDCNPDALLSGSQERRSIDYADLRDLRIDSATDKRHIVFTTKLGSKESISVTAEQVPAVSEVLDRIDSLIGYSAPSTPKAPAAIGRLASLILVVLALLPPQNPVLFVLAALALALPATLSLASLGIAAWTSALLSFAERGAWSWEATPMHLALLVGIGAIPLWHFVLRYRQGEESSRRLRLALTLTGLSLVLLSTVGAVAFVGSELPAMRLHLWARQQPSAIIAATAFAAMCFCHRSRRAKAASLALLTLAGLLFAAGSLGFRQHFTDELFAALAGRLPVEPIDLTKTRSFEVDGAVSQITLSPNKKTVALLIWEDDDYDEPQRKYMVEAADGSLATIEGLALRFVDDNRIAVLGRTEDQTVLRMGTPDSVSAAAPIELPPLLNPELHVEPFDPIWRVIGERIDGTATVVISGKLDSGHRKERTLRSDPATASTFSMGPHGNTLRLTYHYPEWGDGRMSTWLYAFWAASQPVVELSVHNARSEELTVGRTLLGIQCFHAARGAEKFLCMTNGVNSTSAWLIDPSSASIDRIGSFEGFHYGNGPDSNRQLVAQTWRANPALVDLNTRRAAAPILPEHEAANQNTLLALFYGRRFDAPNWGSLDWRGDVLARARTDYESGVSTVTLYTIDWE